MELLASLFEKYGLLLVFGAVFVEQVGPPLPSGPLLIIAGALAREGQVSTVAITAISWGASMLGKGILYVVGRRYGRQAMAAPCAAWRWPRIPIQPAGRSAPERWGAVLPDCRRVHSGHQNARALDSRRGGHCRTPSFLFYSALGAALLDGGLSGHRACLLAARIDRVLDLWRSRAGLQSP
jgi:hypothetical protein